MHTTTVRFHQNVRRALADTELQHALSRTKANFIGHRADAVAAFDQSADFEALREYGRQVRDDGIARMPRLLKQFADRAEAAGATVLWAKDARRATEFIVNIARQHQVRRAVKSKSMASEEIFLNDALAHAGVQVTETDLGEFIIQLGGEKPSHIIAPAMHKTRSAVARLLEKSVDGVTADDDAEALTRAARVHLRQHFLAADMGISGANFLIAETGSSVIVTNEGNGRLTTTLPRVHVTLAGIDKILPSMADLAPMLKLLTLSATGQSLSNYVSITTGARRGDEGPAHAYVILLDNNRSALRSNAWREMLRCIRCGACMNHCPVYHTIGGQAYGSVYMGPMGQVLTGALGGVEKTPDLPKAATLCGACQVVCPVKIPLPTLIRRLREEQVSRRLTSFADRCFIASWSFVARRPRLYALTTALVLRVLAWLGGRQKTIRRLPAASAWFAGRDLKVSGGRSFRSLWKERL